MSCQTRRSTEKPTVPKIPMSKRAWAAGLIDGEGCITITRQAPSKRRISPSHRLYLKVTMTHKPTVARLAAIFEVGSLHRQGKRSARTNAGWSWWVSARQACSVLKLVRPFLVTKAVEADIAFKFMELPVWWKGGRRGNSVVPPELVAKRESLYWKLREAKPSSRFRPGRLSGHRTRKTTA